MHRPREAVAPSRTGTVNGFFVNLAPVKPRGTAGLR